MEAFDLMKKVKDKTAKRAKAEGGEVRVKEVVEKTDDMKRADVLKRLRIHVEANVGTAVGLLVFASRVGRLHVRVRLGVYFRMASTRRPWSAPEVAFDCY